MPKSEITKKDFIETISKIEEEIRTTQAKTMHQVNSNLILMYFRIGKILAENISQDLHFIKKVATEIKFSFPNQNGFSVRNLKSMKKYYLICSRNQKVQTASAQIPWSHNMLIFDKIEIVSWRKRLLCRFTILSYQASLLHCSRTKEFRVQTRLYRSNNKFTYEYLKTKKLVL